MFGWRRRSEGFEWREYVRTTVLVRRADRQRKIDDVRVAAVNKVKDTADRGVAAGRAGVETVAQNTSQILTAAAHALWKAIAAASVATWRATSAASISFWQGVRAGTTFLFDRMPAVPRPKLSLPESLRPQARSGADRGTEDSRPRPDVGFKLPISGNMIGGAAVVLALIFMLGPMLNSESALTPAKFEPAASTVAARAEPSRSSGSAPDNASATGAISGRASVVNGDVLRVNGRFIKLAGIEAPAQNQRCLNEAGRSWNCSSSARAALERIVRRRTVTCTPTGNESDGQTVASCTADEADIAEALVRNGHVFAASGFFATYGSVEAEARTSKAGLWQGEIKRPEDWRKDVWEDAKRSAPDGCPIKGRVRASERVYSMPWSDGYDSSRVRTERGDRWFCSEEEAHAAGFRSSDRS